MPKPVELRDLARRDVRDVVEFYAGVAGEAVARRFVEMLVQAYRAISLHPASGSLRYSYDLKIPGLRSWQVKRYPYIVFYVEMPAYVEVWRVLHAKRDVVSSLREPEGPAGTQ